MKPTDARRLAVHLTEKVPFPGSENPQLWLYAQPVFLNGDTFDKPSQWHGTPWDRSLAKLTLCLTVFARDGWLLPRVEYLDPGDLDRYMLKPMLHRMERIERHMERQSAKNGAPESAGEHVQYFARALGSTSVIWGNDSSCRYLDLAQARFEINNRVADHRRQYGPVAAPAVPAGDPEPDSAVARCSA